VTVQYLAWTEAGFFGFGSVQTRQVRHPEEAIAEDDDAALVVAARSRASPTRPLSRRFMKVGLALAGSVCVVT
tara:strand:+ start:83 stop:301 length:219 start_codon:yes stop_codon:yes gene_type:complete